MSAGNLINTKQIGVYYVLINIIIVFMINFKSIEVASYLIRKIKFLKKLDVLAILIIKFL